MAGLDAVTAALEGAALACWPILLVIIAAIFTYNLAVHTKSMDIVKHMLMTVSKDRRILALLIAWGFGAFMEGMAGFGTAIAIPASMLVALASIRSSRSYLSGSQFRSDDVRFNRHSGQYLSEFDRP